MVEVQEPQGIAFFSVKSGETHYCKLEPTIAAYINSSDMGINASRGQDYGWRLDPDWVKRVRAFKRDSMKMSILTAKNGGQKPNTIQILYYMYGEELQNYYEVQEENENPFEEAYQDAINSGSSVAEAADHSGKPRALADFQAPAADDDDDIGDLIDDTILEEEETPPPATDKPAEAPAKTTDKPADKAAEKPADKPATRSQTKQ